MIEQMSFQMPQLNVGQIYKSEDVCDLMSKNGGTDDYSLVSLHFPRDPITRLISHSLYQPNGEIVLKYHLLPTSDLSDEISGFREMLLTECEHQSRVQRIIDLLRAGEFAFPVFVQSCGPSRWAISEGRHRAIAHETIGSLIIPAFEVGYRSWFEDS